MDDSFAFSTTVPQRPRFDPGLVKAVIFGTFVMLGVAFFASWVVESERRSFARTDPRVAPSEVTITGIEGTAHPSSTDADAERAAGIALAAARAAFIEDRSFLDASPARLSALRPGYIFVDGPSTTPRIVSVASTVDTWAAAVEGPSGICYWIRVTGTEDVTRAIGSECTGAAALNPPAPR